MSRREKEVASPGTFPVAIQLHYAKFLAPKKGNGISDQVIVSITGLTTKNEITPDHYGYRRADQCAFFHRLRDNRSRQQ
jgi:hypothetical protein